MNENEVKALIERFAKSSRAGTLPARAAERCRWILRALHETRSAAERPSIYVTPAERRRLLRI